MQKKAVIAPGGSVVYCEEAMEHYKKTGTVVYLHVSYETVNRRVRNAKGRGVVMREGQTLEMLYREREKLFRKYADITIIQDGLNLEETIDEMLRVLTE